MSLNSNTADTTATSMTGQLGRVAKALETAEASLQKAVLESLSAIDANLVTLEKQDAEIQNQAAALIAAEKAIAEAKREREAEHKVWKIESDLKTVIEIATQNDMAVISQSDLQIMRDKQKSHEDDLAKALKEAEVKHTITTNSIKRELELQHQLATAKDRAELETTKRELATAQATIANLQTQIVDERNARVSIETQRSSPVINVGNNK